MTNKNPTNKNPNPLPQQLDPTRPWYSIQAAAAAEGQPRRAKVLIYDVIGGWFGIRTSEFVRELNALDVDEIDLHLNSPGGAAWDGIAIQNALRQHKATVTVTVDGLAASAASVVAMGGDEVVMARGSQMMIHDASGGAWGPAAFVRKTADILDKLSNTYAGIYAKRTGGTKDAWRELMLAETWYTADEAVEAGLADRTDDDTEADAQAIAAFDLSIFAYAGREHAPAPTMPLNLAASGAVASATKPPASEPGSNTNRKGTSMDFETFLAGLRERLGITDAELDADGVLAALDERLAGQATATAPTLPAGVVAIEQGVLDSLRADAAAGRLAREEQVKARRDGVITTALREGRITKASATAFRAQLDKDEEGAAAILASLAPNTVPVTELGTSSAEADGAADAYPAHWIKD